MTNEEALSAYFALTLKAAKLSTSNTLTLWRAGLLSPDEAEQHAVTFREMAKIMEAAGNDQVAGELWTASRLLDGTARKG